MSNFERCKNVDRRGGRCRGGGLVEVEGRVMWGGGGEKGKKGVFEEVNSMWRRVADGLQGGVH